jgi:hypothetical protein
VRSGEEIMWWEIGVRVRRYTHVCSKEEDRNHTLRHGERKIWRDQILDKKFRHIDSEGY